ncbi:hypothetical protein ALC60_02608 [Trachymyrmex zeteki]|uniref:Uncharacterized protein n=1 Tax=Mycetomoellerius zeteki TaxID=64791 RepID=A0A151XCW1_9HYME|nr:hypothetical protein ALC60_02608 [Trachymyrmex zeteki]
MGHENTAVFKGADPRRPKAARRGWWTVNLPPAHEIIFPSKSRVLNERGHRQHHALVLTKQPTMPPRNAWGLLIENGMHVIVMVARDSTCVSSSLNRNDVSGCFVRRIDIWPDPVRPTTPDIYVRRKSMASLIIANVQFRGPLNRRFFASKVESRAPTGILSFGFFIP